MKAMKSIAKITARGITQDTTVALTAVLLLAITMNIQLDMKMV